MLGRNSTPYERPTARYFRGAAAAVLAIAALITAANAGPARAAQERPAGHAARDGHQSRGALRPAAFARHSRPMERMSAGYTPR
ncbi:hypothetical protein J2Z21_003698 [Streptomyces griseochromogenes]|uniref:Uncharacterized protein n=1 Tax=Streptomyces griseochromogenes TaxID=68214 RepID=A0ABS4LTL2_9ACTN|nr:hypothetical protein [Streptomyces griseochromogenes]